MAIAAVLIDAKRHTFVSAILAIVVGTLVGIIAATSIVAVMGWPETAGYGVAGVFAVSANNLVRWLLRVSKDPVDLLDAWRGRKK